ncbi:MAG TPA: DUF3999 domain-containing protein [Rudaea sp.]|nr:DUF3999 domain-containing protein [Rudaea sp.]
MSEYAYAWPLYTDGDSAAWQVELTPEVYAVLHNEDLSDLEIVNAAGAAVPIAPYRAPATVAERERDIDLPLFAVPAPAAGTAADEAIRLHIERSADGKLHKLDADVGAAPAATTPGDVLLLDASALHDPLSNLHIAWSGNASVTAQFAIDASDDLEHWRTLAERATVLELVQNGNVLGRHDIALGNARASYLRLRRLDRGAALPELRVGARVVSYSTPAAPALQWIAATLDGTATDAAQPPGFRYRLPASLAATSVKLELADDNSVVAGTVLSKSAPETAGPWTLRNRFVAFRIHEGNAMASNDEFALSPAARARDWRIELATPLEHAPTLSIAYRPDRFVFLAQGAGPYRLVAGSVHARRGEYPIDAALAPLRAKLGADWQPPLTRLGAREVLEGAQALEAAPVQRKPDWKRWLLWGVLVAAAGVVGGLALSLLRRPNH